MPRMLKVVVPLVWLIGLVADPVAALDPVVQQAQQQLHHLGYDPGMVDGIYGPRTRHALAAFQRAQNLPVTGILDTITLRKLDQAATSQSETPSPPPARSANPLLVVLDYLRFYPSQPARVLPYVTEHFRRGVAPSRWIDQTRHLLQAQPYTYLAWKVQRLAITDAQATVEVHTHVQSQGQELSQRETFTLLRDAEGEWLIDDWHTEPFPLSKESPQATSQG